MKILSRVFISLSILILMAIGVVLILNNSSLFSFQFFVEDYFKENMELFYLTIGIVFFVVSFLATYVTFSSHKKDKAITLYGKFGEIKIALYALEDYIKRICLKEPFIKTVSVNVFLKKKNIVAKIKAVICSGYNIPEIISKIQINVKGFLENDLNFSEESEIKIFISKILPSEDKKNIALKEKEEKESNYYEQ
ncbi:alkaline shock response membrane anchor protein AmaP [bacterium]|nr:alkaline shock response membrane anchor protein AmaP [bacterium]MBU0899822.1 alkaline shock response membrane anchor protein AmaP [bacterium]MBU1152370.1 alkaline shock response membrane anchor protein AmaP [bacterium]MBU1782325.1 alkaline shock response membrane anchor protein AmaP [bacterium]